MVTGAVLFGLGWLGHAEFGNVSSSKSPAAVVPVANARPTNAKAAPPAVPPAQRPSSITATEMQQLRAARQATIDGNPDLTAEYKQIKADLQAQQAKLDEAMIKADPKVAPTLAKLAEMRQRALAHISVPMPAAH